MEASGLNRKEREVALTLLSARYGCRIFGNTVPVAVARQTPAPAVKQSNKTAPQPKKAEKRSKKDNSPSENKEEQSSIKGKSARAEHNRNPVVLQAEADLEVLRQRWTEANEALTKAKADKAEAEVIKEREALASSHYANWREGQKTLKAAKANAKAAASVPSPSGSNPQAPPNE
jgi:hypothetical protein